MGFKDFEETVKERLNMNDWYFPAGQQSTKIKCKVKYLTVDLLIEDERQKIEEIMTRVINCDDNMKQPGDIYLIYEERYMTKTGQLLDTIKYVEAENP